MSYQIVDDDLSFAERVCRINNVDLNDLDVEDFEVDYNLQPINDFKEKLLSDKDKRFFIVGDYDCDGICAVTIIKRLFSDLDISSNYYIPSRSKEGYGLSDSIVKKAYDNGFEALLCVDNGAVAYDQLQYARKLGLKTYVIDHHEYKKKADVDGFLHSDLFTDQYHDMCAAGLCTLLASSLKKDELSIVYGGLATLADMVSVLGYNRYLLKKMLEILNSRHIYPIEYLLNGNEISYDSLSYNVIPKINAVSRLEELMNVNYVVRFLLEDSSSCAKYLSLIEKINNTRKNLTVEMSSLAQRLVNDDDDFIIVSNTAFKEGICGLIANKLLNQYNKPVLILSESDGQLKGSGRSPEGFDLYSYLERCKDLFSAYGGHGHAIGLAMDAEKLSELKTFVRNNPIDIKDNSRIAFYYPHEALDMNLLNEIEKLEPFGTGFKKPLLCIDGEYLKKYIIKGMYPKFVLNDTLEAISFNAAYKDKDFSRMIGHLRKDSYHKNRLSFVIEDLI